MAENYYDFVVVGAGIVGAATAARLSELQPGKRTLLIEKEDGPARHQTGRNSGVVHTGAYYTPGSKKAELCREGLARTRHYCKTNGLAYEQRGKLLVATTAIEEARLENLAARAIENGVAIHEVSRPQLKCLEPNVSGRAAIRLPETAIVSYSSIASSLVRDFLRNGGSFSARTKLTSIRSDGNNTTLVTDRGALICGQLIVCGGLHSDRIMRMAGLSCSLQVVPFRGEYYRLPSGLSKLVSHLIYPVPDPDLPFLGIHLTPMIDGSITVGPNAILALAREKYSKLSLNAADVLQSSAFPGLWRSLAKHPAAAAKEIRSAVSKRYYLRQVQKYCPSIKLGDLKDYIAGHRAQIVHRDGRLEDDFLFRTEGSMTFVLNAPSPAATSALPIAEEICRRVLDSSGAGHAAVSA